MGMGRVRTCRPTSRLCAGRVNLAMLAGPTRVGETPPRPISRTRRPTSIAPSTAATIASGVDTATSTPHASVNSHSLRASLMRATIRPTPNSPLASSAMARLALSSPVAAIATSQLCSCASSSDDSSQASARNQSAPGTRAGTYRVNSRSINSTL